METIYSFETLRQFALQVFNKIGCSPEDANRATEVLLSADLRGIDSHGLARLSGYVRLWEADRVNSKPHVRIVHESL